MIQEAAARKDGYGCRGGIDGAVWLALSGGVLVSLALAQTLAAQKPQRSYPTEPVIRPVEVLLGTAPTRFEPTLVSYSGLTWRLARVEGVWVPAETRRGWVAGPNEVRHLTLAATAAKAVSGVADREIAELAALARTSRQAVDEIYRGADLLVRALDSLDSDRPIFQTDPSSDSWIEWLKRGVNRAREITRATVSTLGLSERQVVSSLIRYSTGLELESIERTIRRVHAESGKLVSWGEETESGSMGLLRVHRLLSGNPVDAVAASRLAGRLEMVADNAEEFGERVRIIDNALNDIEAALGFMADLTQFETIARAASRVSAAHRRLQNSIGFTERLAFRYRGLAQEIPEEASRAAAATSRFITEGASRRVTEAQRAYRDILALHQRLPAGVPRATPAELRSVRRAAFEARRAAGSNVNRALIAAGMSGDVLTAIVQRCSSAWFSALAADRARIARSQWLGTPDLRGVNIALLQARRSLARQDALGGIAALGRSAVALKKAERRAGLTNGLVVGVFGLVGAVFAHLILTLLGPPPARPAAGVRDAQHWRG